MKKKPDVYMVEDKLKTLWKILLIITLLSLILPALCFITQNAIFMYITLIIIATSLIIAMISLPIAYWVDKKKQSLRDNEKCFITCDHLH